MWCQNGSPGVCSQKTKRVVLIPEEQGRGTLLPPSESLFSFHEKCLQGNHRWITGSSSHGNVVFYLNKPCGLNAALGGAKLVWFEDGAGGSKCSEWWMQQTKISRAPGTNHSLQSSYTFPGCLKTSLTISHFLQGCDMPARVDVIFIAHPECRGFVTLSCGSAFQTPNLRSPALCAPSFPARTAEPWWHPCSCFATSYAGDKAVRGTC